MNSICDYCFHWGGGGSGKMVCVFGKAKGTNRKMPITNGGLGADKWAAGGQGRHGDIHFAKYPLYLLDFCSSCISIKKITIIKSKWKQ